ncbi:MAG: glycosyltransferase family 4 protein [Verrucomicrobiia bacterium]
MTKSPRIFFIANGVFSEHIAGGDIHFLEMARALVRKGYEVHFLGGFVLEKVIASWQLSVSFHPTEEKMEAGLSDRSFFSQIVLFWNYTRRCLKAFQILNKKTKQDDVVYAVSDYWFDVLPTVRSHASYKVGVWHMEAPSFEEILFRKRADVPFSRLPSFHNWLSQKLSLKWLSQCVHKKIFYLHPDMREKLLALGCQCGEISLISYGVDVATPQKIGEVEKEYDVIWLGRLHRQKGVDDIIPTLNYLAERVDNFKAVIVGKVKEGLQPMIGKPLANQVFFPGFVSEEEKFRLLKASRVFVMPSRHEGSPRVIGEALLCGTRVVAYDVKTYFEMFHDWIYYVPKFDLFTFQKEVENQVIQSRNQTKLINSFDLEQFKNENSWEATGEHFVKEIQKLLVKN